jgi:hypothetical protein
LVEKGFNTKVICSRGERVMQELFAKAVIIGFFGFWVYVIISVAFQ